MRALAVGLLTSGVFWLVIAAIFGVLYLRPWRAIDSRDNTK
jgi:hypothetical protein